MERSVKTGDGRTLLLYALHHGCQKPHAQAVEIPGNQKVNHSAVEKGAFRSLSIVMPIRWDPEDLM